MTNPKPVADAPADSGLRPEFEARLDAARAAWQAIEPSPPGVPEVEFNRLVAIDADALRAFNALAAESKTEAILRWRYFNERFEPGWPVEDSLEIESAAALIDDLRRQVFQEVRTVIVNGMHLEDDSRVSQEIFEAIINTLVLRCNYEVLAEAKSDDDDETKAAQDRYHDALSAVMHMAPATRGDQRAQVVLALIALSREC